MATLYVSEYTSVVWAGVSGHQLIPAPYAPANIEQSIAIGGASVSSNPFNAKTKFIQVHTDAVCSLGFNTPAVTTAHRLGANETRFYGVDGGFIAVIANT